MNNTSWTLSIFHVCEGQQCVGQLNGFSDHVSHFHSRRLMTRTYPVHNDQIVFIMKRKTRFEPDNPLKLWILPRNCDEGDFFSTFAVMYCVIEEDFMHQISVVHQLNLHYFKSFEQILKIHLRLHINKSYMLLAIFDVPDSIETSNFLKRDCL